MGDPTYDIKVINENPIWKRAFELSELENDNASLGWSRYILRAKAEILLLTDKLVSE